MKLSLCAALMLAGCGGAGPNDWTAQDATQVSDLQRGSLAIYQQSDGGIVRALGRADYCSATSVLVRHGADMPDGGPQCPTQ